jgi:hypothetical protein
MFFHLAFWQKSNQQSILAEETKAECVCLAAHEQGKCVENSVQ